MAGFTPTYHAPAGSGKGSCTTAQITGFDTKCLNGTNCGTSSAGTATCLACLLTTDPTASTWAPVIEQQGLGYYELNGGGCYAAEAAAELACGQATEALLECEHYECDPSALSLAQFQSCQTKSDTGSCKCFATAATTACSSFTSSACNLDNATTFDGAFESLAAVMCGP